MGGAAHRLRAGRPRSERGFTLAEVLVALAFASVLGALVWSFARAAFVGAAAQQARSEAQDTAHLALSVITRDLRQAGFAPSTGTIVALERAEATRVLVHADLDGDGDFDGSGESVSYQENAARQTLTRTAGASAPQPLADRLVAGSLRFAYFDATGAALEPGASGLDLETRRRVRRVDVGFAMLAPSPDGPLRIGVSASVELRNGG